MGDLLTSVWHAIPLLKRLEGCRLEAYPDPATKADPWTIGYGATGPGIVKGTRWTQSQADEDLTTRCVELANLMSALVTAELSSISRAALISFAYNVGLKAFKHSRLLRLVNENKPLQAAEEFARWTRAGGKHFPPLVRRRQIEREIFLAGLQEPPDKTGR